MLIRLSAIATTAAVIAGCAGLPPGLAPEPDARSTAIYIPAAAGQPASVELAPAPDNSWRTPAQASTQPREIRLTQLVLAGDGGAAIRKLISILTMVERPSPNDVAVSLGPPPIADMEGPRVVVEWETRDCEATEGIARFPEVRGRTCPSPHGAYDAWRLPVGAAGLDITDLREALAPAGYRDQGPRPPNLNLHPPNPGTESVFVRAEGDPVIVVSHLREGPPRPAHVSIVSLIWPRPSVR